MNQRKTGGRAHAVSGVFIFFLIGMFALMCTLLMLIGARAYRAVAQNATVDAEGQIAISYLLGKMHACDSSGQVSLAEIDGTPVLVLRENDEDFETRIYYGDGAICESYAEIGSPLDKEAGQRLVTAQRFELTQENDRLLHVLVQRADADALELHLALRATGGQSDE